jgi:hypothetical protein
LRSAGNPKGKQWAAFLFGLFNLIRDFPVTHPAGARCVQIHSNEFVGMQNK